MKYKEVVKQLNPYRGDEKKLWRELLFISQKEIRDRIELRSSGRPPSADLVDSVLAEMAVWVDKIGQALAMKEETIKLLVNSERGKTFVEYKLVDPRARKQQIQFQMAMMQGKRPIDVLTREGLDAIGGMIMGKMVNDAREWRQKTIDGKNYCPHGDAARKCDRQVSYADKMPKSVDDVRFYCVDDVTKCDWQKKTGNQ